MIRMHSDSDAAIRLYSDDRRKTYGKTFQIITGQHSVSDSDRHSDRRADRSDRRHQFILPCRQGASAAFCFSDGYGCFHGNAVAH